MAMGDGGRIENTSTVSAMNYSTSPSGNPSQEKMLPSTIQQPMYSSGSIPSDGTSNLSYPSTATATNFSSAMQSANFAPQNYHLASTSSQLPITSTPSNYMVTATGDMVIPSRYALSVPTDMPPPPPVTMYTDSVLTSNLDTINYTPLRMDRSNPMMGITQPQKNQYQYH